jgi:hypothetical protein
MALDEARTERDYLYGRLLAIADVLEERTISKTEKNRPTNATRYIQQFSQRPFRTWKQIHESLVPYLMRQGENASYYKKMIGEVEKLFAPEDFIATVHLQASIYLGSIVNVRKCGKRKNLLLLLKKRFLVKAEIFIRIKEEKLWLHFRTRLILP